MAMAITNPLGSVALDFQTAITGASTQFQFAATATSTSAGTSLHWEFTDGGNLTTQIPNITGQVAGSMGDFGAARRSFRALVYIKSLTLATATSTTTVTNVGPVVALEAATSTSFAPLYILDQKTIHGSTTVIASTDPRMCFTLSGMTPIVAGCQFARINFLSANSPTQSACSTAVDVIIEAA